VILGLTPLVLIHTLISLVGIATGFGVLAGLLRSERLDRWTAWFLASTILTSASGFILPAAKFLPSHAVGILSLAILALACYARYAKRMAGGWRAAYVASAVAALYFNVFVLVAQLFLKVPALHALAPTQSEPPFAVAQGIVLLVFAAAGVLAVRRFHPR
jgi:hypothetical protein